jgi:UPF0271 protein
MPETPLPLDLNCDLAEGEPPAHTAALLAGVSSANVACAGHAGSRDAMRHALALGQSLGVALGAHPGRPGGFGRTAVTGFTGPDLRALLDEQVGRFLELAAAAGSALHHVKLHGSLYHATEHDPSLRAAFIDWLRSHTPQAIVYARAGGSTVADARRAGLTAWDEGFADRAYRADGSLVPRDHPGAVITSATAVTERVARLARGQPIATVDGLPLRLDVRTLCLHGDSPESLTLLAAARQGLEASSPGTRPPA